MSEEVAVARAFGHTSAFRSIFGTNVGIGSQSLIIDGTEEQKHRYLPKMATGEVIGSFCRQSRIPVLTRLKTQRSEMRQLCTQWHETLDHNAPKADLFTVFARTNPDELGSRGVSAFLVDANASGIQLGQPYRKMGQQGTYVCDVMFDDVLVPAENMVGGKENVGFKTVMKFWTKADFTSARSALG